MPLITVVVQESASLMVTAWSNADQHGVHREQCVLFVSRILRNFYVNQVQYEFCVTFVCRKAPRRAAGKSSIKFEITGTSEQYQNILNMSSRQGSQFKKVWKMTFSVDSQHCLIRCDIISVSNSMEGNKTRSLFLWPFSSALRDSAVSKSMLLID